MHQVDTNNVAKTLNWISVAIVWIAGVIFLISILSFGSQAAKPLGLFVIPSLFLFLLGYVMKGLAALIFNQIKNNELLEAILEKKS